MKRISILRFLPLAITGVLLAACDPGTFEYGYAYNPKFVMFRVFDSLKTGDYQDDWMLLFSGKMICYYTSDEGIALLKSTLGNPDTAPERLTVSEPELIAAGTRIKGYRDHDGTILSGERYRVRVAQKSNGTPVFTVLLSCFESDDGRSRSKSCSITDLTNHVRGNPDLPVCEGIRR